jgi:hypothetical protein
MKTRSFACAALVALIAVSLAGAAFAQDTQVHPRYTTLPTHYAAPLSTPPTALTTWNGSFEYEGKSNSFIMVGTNPATTNTTTTFQVEIIPVKLSITSKGTTYTFDPMAKLSSGKSPVQYTVASPLFKSVVDWNQGGTDLGKTQYEDAFQRGNFWTDVMTNTSYHTMLSAPKLEPEQSFTVPKADATVDTVCIPGCFTAGEVNINWFDNQIQTMLTKLKIQPNTIPIFITYDLYLTDDGCCIGGYHSADTNGQTYSMFTYIDVSGNFSQDVSALSHELGEWYDDPLVNNTQGACGGLLEVGDPLEGTTNFGTYPYTVGGFTYHLQDLVFLKYFGQTPSTSVNDWWTFQNYPFTQVCQNGQ